MLKSKSSHFIEVVMRSPTTFFSEKHNYYHFFKYKHSSETMKTKSYNVLLHEKIMELYGIAIATL